MNVPKLEDMPCRPTRVQLFIVSTRPSTRARTQAEAPLNAVMLVGNLVQEDLQLTCHACRRGRSQSDEWAIGDRGFRDRCH
jgi:hypothetical protein